MNDSPRSVDRREALAAIGLAAAALPSLAIAQPPSVTTPNSPAPKDGGKPPIAIVPANAAPAELKIFDEAAGQFVLPALPYAKDALEPHIDTQTMEIHHGKHHAAYVAGVNKALAELARIRTAAGDSALIKHWANQVSFHLSGHVNHALFWNMLAPAGKGGGGTPGGDLAKAIAASFGLFEQFVAQFKATAASVEGGGWAWLAVEPWSKQLVLIQQEKQQDMWVTGAQPVLGIDVWEHAYYMKYQNRRADYVAAFLNVVNWRFCESLFSCHTNVSRP